MQQWHKIFCMFLPFVLLGFLAIIDAQQQYQNSSCLMPDATPGLCDLLFQWTVFNDKINISISGLNGPHPQWMGIGFASYNPGLNCFITFF
jgi:hypothetical protein